MQFKGTPRYPAGTYDRLLSREGGVFNAMTWLDYTAYFETLPASRVDLALDIEADRMVNSLFDPDEVRRCRARPSKRILTITKLSVGPPTTRSLFW